jgi:hypothetical protein
MKNSEEELKIFRAKQEEALKIFETNKANNRKECFIKIAAEAETYSYNIIVSRRFQEYAIYPYEYIEYLPNDTFSEVLYQGDLNNSYYRFYLDIDLDINECDHTEAYDNMINALNASLIVINKLKPETSQMPDILFDDLIFMNGCGISKSKYKFSYHIIYKTAIFAKLTNIYNLLTYLIDTTFSEYKFKGERLIDTAPYVSSQYLSYNFKFANQSKQGEPHRIMKIENGTFADTLITIPKSTQKYLIDNNCIEAHLTRKAKARGIIKNDIADVININTPLLNKQIEQTIINRAIQSHAYLRRTSKYNPPTRTTIYERLSGANQSSEGVRTEEVNILLDTIPNTYDNPQDFKAWIDIIYMLKRIEKVENINLQTIAEEWTLRAYYKEYKRPKEQQKNAEKVRQATDNMQHIYNNITLNPDEEHLNKYALISLYNIAVFYNKSIRKDILYSKNFNRLYNIDYTPLQPLPNGGHPYIKVHTLTESDPMPSFADFKETAETITTNAGMGEGKTQATFDLFINALECGNENTFTFIASNRILYGKAIQADFNKKLKQLNHKPIIFYTDLKTELHNGHAPKDILIRYSGVICSIETMGQDWISNFWVELLRDKNELFSFYDESETLIDSIFSNLNTKQEEGLNILRRIWGKSKINIAVDAFYSIKTRDFVDNLNELTGRTNRHIHIDTQNRNKYPKTLNITDIIDIGDEGEIKDAKQEVKHLLKSKIINYLINPINRVVAVIETYSDIDELKSLLNEIYKDPTYNLTAENVIIHAGGDRQWMTTEELEENNAILTKPDGFKNIRLWIYNLAIANGVSVVSEHFNIGVCVMGNFGITANTILNAMGRARQTTEWDISIIANKKNKNINNTTDINKIKALITDKHLTITSKEEYTDTTDLIDDVEQNELNINTYNKLNNDTDRYYKQETATAIQFYEYEQSSGGDKIRVMTAKYRRFELSKILYELYVRQQAITADLRELTLRENIKVNNTFENNFNLQDKADIFQDLARLKKYNVIYNLRDKKERQTQLSNIPEHIEGIIQKSTYNLIRDIKPKSATVSGAVEAAGANFDKTLYNMNLIDANYITNTETMETIDKIKILVSTGKISVVKRYSDNWDNFKNKRDTPIFRHSIIAAVLEIFKVKTPSQLPKSLNSLAMKTSGLYEKLKPISEMFRKLNKKAILTPKTTSHRTTITELNNLLEPMGLVYKSVSSKGRKEREYTYILDGVNIDTIGQFADNSEIFNIAIDTLQMINIYNWDATKCNKSVCDELDEDNTRCDEKLDFIEDIETEDEDSEYEANMRRLKEEERRLVRLIELLAKLP